MIAVLESLRGTSAAQGTSETTRQDIITVTGTRVIADTEGNRTNESAHPRGGNSRLGIIARRQLMKRHRRRPLQISSAPAC